jgi:hypothetical protein
MILCVHNNLSLFVCVCCLATRLSDGGNHRGHLQQLIIKGYFWHKNKSHNRFWWNILSQKGQQLLQKLIDLQSKKV